MKITYESSRPQPLEERVTIGGQHVGIIRPSFGATHNYQFIGKGGWYYGHGKTKEDAIRDGIVQGRKRASQIMEDVAFLDAQFTPLSETVEHVEGGK